MLHGVGHDAQPSADERTTLLDLSANWRDALDSCAGEVRLAT